MKQTITKVSTFLSASLVSLQLFSLNVLAQGYDYSYNYSSSSEPNGAVVFLIVCCSIFIPLVLMGALAYWTYKDAQKNNIDNPALWAVLVFIFGLVPLLIYLLAIRKKI